MVNESEKLHASLFEEYEAKYAKYASMCKGKRY